MIATLQQIDWHPMTWPDTENFRLKPQQTLVFTGDSITHWYGGPDQTAHPLGLGYCAMAGNMLTRIYREYDLQVHNRGISGNKVSQVLERCERDVLSLTPDWVSLLIGINDTASDTNPGTPDDRFEADYRALLGRLSSHAKIVMMTPFFAMVPNGARKLQADLNRKIAIVSSLAEEFAQVFIPRHDHFARAATAIDPALLLPDGVHPSQMGHGLIADCWREGMGAQRP
jgi:lysophospholipase L1-like esterase